jgi:hypothetical protein
MVVDRRWGNAFRLGRWLRKLAGCESPRHHEVSQLDLLHVVIRYLAGLHTGGEWFSCFIPTESQITSGKGSAPHRQSYRIRDGRGKSFLTLKVIC